MSKLFSYVHDIFYRRVRLCPVWNVCDIGTQLAQPLCTFTRLLPVIIHQLAVLSCCIHVRLCTNVFTLLRFNAVGVYIGR